MESANWEKENGDNEDFEMNGFEDESEKYEMCLV